MLQAIRSKSSSFIVKALFVLLSAVFALWGVGDIFRNWGVDTNVAKVGSMVVTADQLNQAVRNELAQLSNALGKSIDMEQAKKLGLVDAALQRIIDGGLIDQETRRLGLAIGNGTLRDAIIDNPNFKGPNGEFDRKRYAQLLAANQLTEAQFETELRQDLIRNQLTSALLNGVTPPPLLVDTLYRSRAEHRTAEVVTVTPKAVPAAPQPSDAQLTAYYASHKEAFRTEERRSFTLALLRLEDIAATIKVPEARLEKAYQDRRADFRTPEQRDVQQMLLPSEAKAKAAKAALISGKTFAAVAKEEAGADASSTDLGWVKRSDLPSQLAKVAFSLPEGNVSDPIKTSFGWQILRVKGIKPSAEKPFDAVKKQLAQQFARDEAANQIATIANNIDDALAGGDKFMSVVQKFGLKTESVADVNAQGDEPDGKKDKKIPQPAKTVLHTAFTTDSGQTSQLTELGDDGYFIVHMDKVAPSVIPPLSAVHDKVVAAWRAEQTKQAVAKLADAIAKEVKAGKSLKNAAAEHKLTVTTTPALGRNGDDPSVPPALLAALFDAKQGGVVTVPSGDDNMVAQVTAVDPADPAKNPAAVKNLSGQIANEMRGDVMTAVDHALRTYFPVTINQTNIDRLL